MAGDWIKMRTDLYRDPKVLLIADELMRPDGDLARYVNQNTQRDMSVTRNVLRNVTVGALVSVWGVMRHRGKRDGNDLVALHVTLSALDDIADLPGFGDAMASSGWVSQTDEGLVFPRFFEEHNSDPEERKREKARERQRRHRNRDNERDESVTVTHREEKSRVIASANAEATDDPANGSSAVGGGAEFHFAKQEGVWTLPVKKLAQYEATYGDRLDVRAELRKARQWLLDHKSRRPRGDVAGFLTRWLNRSCDSRPRTVMGGRVADAGDPRAVFNPETGEIVIPRE